MTKDEIIDEIKNLKINKSPGQDEFTAKFIKLREIKIAPVLCEIFNLSIKTGEYPDPLKIAKVIPIFKKGDKTKCPNYRPISLLSNVSKIFERIMYNQLEMHLNSNSILYKHQYGFRKKILLNMLYLALLKK